MAGIVGLRTQYIKSAPVLTELDRRGVDYLLIDSGQHAAFSVSLRRQLGVREPDVRLREHADVVTLGAAAIWFGSLLLRSLLRRRWLREEVFRHGPGVCIVHGDTPSTLLAVLMARLTGCRVVHIEAGLRSYRWLRPFPEEFVRVVAMHLSDLLFTPSDLAQSNLERMRVRGRAVNLGQNTSIEALHHALSQAEDSSPAAPYALMTLHRVETLTSARRLSMAVEWALRIARELPLVFVLHEPTRVKLVQHGLFDRLEASPGIRLLELQPYPAFVAHLAGAEFAITDGGSIQEECYYLGLPCLLARSETERHEGVGENVVLGQFAPGDLEHFLSHYASLRRAGRVPSQSPSRRLVDALLERYSIAGREPGGQSGKLKDEAACS